MSCCICAQVSTEGTRDKSGRFVCAECLERARQSIIQRRAREARAKVDAKLAEEVARVESDNSEVLRWQSALDPAFALLCPSCGRILHLDVGACHACGYGLDNQAVNKRFSLFGRRRSRQQVAPHLLALNASWLNAIDPRVESVLPVLLAILLWTTTVLGWFRLAARVSASMLVVAALAALTAWFLFALAQRSVKAAVLSAVLPAAAVVLVVFDPLPAHPGVRWVGLGVLLVFTTAVVLSRARGSFVGLWVVSTVAALGLVVVHGLR